MEEVEAGEPVTAAEAVAMVEAAGFPPTALIAFPDGIEAPAHPHDTGFFDLDDPSEMPAIELHRQQRCLEHDEQANVVTRAVRWFVRSATGHVREEFSLGRHIAYVDSKVGVVIVPADLGPFRTDLTSVPRFFAWLVPKTGLHLPAAILHDGLVHDEAEPRTYIAPDLIERETADRIFRDAMGDLGTSLLRRWLIWTTVMLATLTSARDRARWIPTIAATAILVVALGTLATIDLLDHRDVLPWMGERPLVVELVTGLIAAIAVATVVALAWGRLWIAGFISATAVAFLFHVTALIVVVSSTIGVLEGVGDRDGRKVVAHGLVLTVVGGAVLVVAALAQPG
ncbi:DUF1353 domain-containing protein [Ilumatobacter sp.]|uniref:DUF1353 domain-containing protein n=1 Tax=Ilumatobacter sp. TaxID=1967498 RepID=UPI003B526EE3